MSIGNQFFLNNGVCWTPSSTQFWSNDMYWHAPVRSHVDSGSTYDDLVIASGARLDAPSTVNTNGGFYGSNIPFHFKINAEVSINPDEDITEKDSKHYRYGDYYIDYIIVKVSIQRNGVNLAANDVKGYSSSDSWYITGGSDQKDEQQTFVNALANIADAFVPYNLGAISAMCFEFNQKEWYDSTSTYTEGNSYCWKFDKSDVFGTSLTNLGVDIYIQPAQGIENVNDYWTISTTVETKVICAGIQWYYGSDATTFRYDVYTKSYTDSFTITRIG